MPQLLIKNTNMNALPIIRTQEQPQT